MKDMFLRDVRFVQLVEETNFVSPHRWFKHAGESYIKVPFLGAVSYLTLAVTPFCIAFAILWAVNRDKSFAWIGQDILVSILSYSDISCRLSRSEPIFFFSLAVCARARACCVLQIPLPIRIITFQLLDCVCRNSVYFLYLSG